MGSPARPPTGSWSPGGCPPRSTPSPPTRRDTALASFRPAGSRRTRTPCSMTWTRAASSARVVSSVQAPVLLLADPRDALVPIGTARRLARALPDACLLLVQDTGHHLPRRAPDTVAPAIAAFLAATEDQPPVRRRAAAAT